ncbi:hypothetical protein RGCCGE502_10060 [Rhizobium grahamii CCGE 502]|uniref:Uncharacterized protein n=1 Tax=Rhizobium grahamii CCGE 502 TaxID=990285 RepID=S3IIS7_9HYPH|nr:hypothetical protein RGCCGE502_10060 [Rhizobium grahamii CCGE 502]
MRRAMLIRFSTTASSDSATAFFGDCFRSGAHAPLYRGGKKLLEINGDAAVAARICGGSVE